jgi:hypothetical protein
MGGRPALSPEPALAVGAEAISSARHMHVIRLLDVVAVLIAAAPAVVLGAPALGYGVGAGAWIVQRVIAGGERRFLLRVEEPRRWVGARLFASFGRIWLLAGAIIAAGVGGGRRDGLTAAVVIFAAYSIAFAIRIASGPPERGAA